METAIASRPLSAARRTASCNSVSSDLMCARPSAYGTEPISASTEHPAACAYWATRRVPAIFSSSGNCEPSYMTDVNPASTALNTSAMLYVWSRCTHTGTGACSAAARSIGAITSIGINLRKSALAPRMTGAPTSAAALTTACASSQPNTLKHPTLYSLPTAGPRIVARLTSIRYSLVELCDHVLDTGDRFDL